MTYPDTWKFDRLTQLSLLAITVLAYSVVEMAIANSLFLTYVGAQELPVVFILIGLCSLPSYLLFSQIVDRFSRPRLFRFALVGAIAMALGLRGLIALDSPWVYYLLMVTIFFQWDFHNTLLYSSLLTDYFTATEYKRNAPFIGIAQAIGTLVGGLLTTVLTLGISTRDLLLFCPVLLGIALGQLIGLERTQQPLERLEPQGAVGVIEAIKTFPRLVKRYPLMLFLASSSFLLVIIYLTTEFLWFSVYSEHFSNDELTQFLGLLRVVVSLLKILVLYGFTRPLLRWLGVARMNIVYPLTTLASLAGFLLNANLTTSIGLHLNGDALYKSINLPVHQLNYNAVPREFMGRIRTLSDGVFYSLGLTMVGVFLWIAHDHLTLTEIGGIALGLTLLFLVLRIPMGQYYGAGLEEMIRAEAIDLDALPQGSLLASEQSIALAKELLHSEDTHTLGQGLDLAIQLGKPREFLADIPSLSASPNHDIRLKIAQLFGTQLPPSDIPRLLDLLHHTDPQTRELGLELLNANQFEFSPLQLEAFRNDPDPIIQTLAAALTIVCDRESDAGQRAFHTLSPPFSELEGNALIRVAVNNPHPCLIAMVGQVLSNPQLTLNGLHALTQLAERGIEKDPTCCTRPLNPPIHSPEGRGTASLNHPPSLFEIAQGFLKHPDSAVRVAAFELLAQCLSDQNLEMLSLYLNDESPRVRAKISEILVDSGEPGLALARQYLTSSNPHVAEIAMTTLGKIRTQQSADLLFDALVPEFDCLARTRKWQKNMPTEDVHWHLLSICLVDYQQRLIQKVLLVLSCLGHHQTVASVNRALRADNIRDRANAVEVLSSLKDRRFIRPLLPLLEESSALLPKSPHPAGLPWLRTKGYKILLEAFAEKDRWIRMAALVALASIPQALILDPDPLVKAAAQQVFPIADVSGIPHFMNRILLLKKVPIFKNLTLDELQLINEALVPEQVLAQQTIFEEGSWGTHFYLIESGTIQLFKMIQGESLCLKTLTIGDYFGEVSLFDEAPRWDSAIASEPSALLKLEKSKFMSLMTQRPHISLEICRYLSRRLREYDQFRSVELAHPLN